MTEWGAQVEGSPTWSSRLGTGVDSGIGVCSELAQSSWRKGIWIRSSLFFLILISSLWNVSLHSSASGVQRNRCVKPGCYPGAEVRFSSLQANSLWSPGMFLELLNCSSCSSRDSSDWTEVRCSGTNAATLDWNKLLQDSQNNQLHLNSIPSICSMCHFMNLKYFAYEVFYYWDTVYQVWSVSVDPLSSPGKHCFLYLN